MKILSVGGVGGKLKECQVCPESEYWSPPNTGATNESAFTALPAGWKVDWAEDFANLNGEIACREAGKLRQEGKGYIVKDGDVFRFLFNI